MGLRIDREFKKTTTQELRCYLNDELDLDVGDLKAELLLEFVLSRVASSIYNQGVADSQSWIQDKLLDLDGEVFEPDPDAGS